MLAGPGLLLRRGPKAATGGLPEHSFVRRSKQLAYGLAASLRCHGCMPRAGAGAGAGITTRRRSLEASRLEISTKDRLQLYSCTGTVLLSELNVVLSAAQRLPRPRTAYYSQTVFIRIQYKTEIRVPCRLSMHTMNQHQYLVPIKG